MPDPRIKCGAGKSGMINVKIKGFSKLLTGFCQNKKSHTRGYFGGKTTGYLPFSINKLRVRGILQSLTLFYLTPYSDSGNSPLIIKFAQNANIRSLFH
jgi:hypothetical protein